MTDPMHHQLLGHLLGALDDDEQESVDSRLQYDARYRQELLQWRRRLARLDALRPEFEPPPGLAERTCRYAAAHGAPPATPPCSPCKRMRPEPAPPIAPTSAGWFDMATIVVFLVVLCGVIASAIDGRRFRVQTAASQDVFRQLDLASDPSGQPQSRSPMRLADVSASPSPSRAIAPFWERVVRAAPASSLRQWGVNPVAGGPREDAGAAWTVAELIRRVPNDKTTTDWPGAWRTGTTADRRFPPSPAGMPLLADAPSADPPGQVPAIAVIRSGSGLFHGSRISLLSDASSAVSNVAMAEEDLPPRVITAPIVFVNSR